MIRDRKSLRETAQYDIASNKALCVALDDAYKLRASRKIVNRIIDQDYYTVDDIDELADSLRDHGEDGIADELQDAIASDRQVCESARLSKKRPAIKESIEDIYMMADKLADVFSDAGEDDIADQLTDELSRAVSDEDVVEIVQCYEDIARDKGIELNESVSGGLPAGLRNRVRELRLMGKLKD